MDRTNQAIDEYTLAAFLGGTLSDQRRAEVIAYLAQNADARELLQMTYEAMQAARPDGASAAPPLSHAAGAAPASVPQAASAPEAVAVTPAASREAARRPARRFTGLRRYAAATVVIFAVGLSLRLILGPPTDALRSPVPAQAGELGVQVSASDLTLRWHAVPEAYRYRITVWDPQEARVVARTETTAPVTDRADAFTIELREKLSPGRAYTLRIDAVDVQNRVLQSSPAVAFTPAH